MVGINSFKIKILTLVSAFTAGAVFASDPPKKPVVFLESIEPKESFEKLSYPGQVVSRMNARFLAEGDGVVTQILRGVGTQVRKGDVLLIVKNGDAAYNFAPLQIRAPAKGVVASLDVSLGSQVTKGQLLGNLVDPSNPKVVIEVPASDLGKIRIGQNSQLQVSDLSERIELKVESKAPVVDPTTGTARIELSAVTSNSKKTTEPSMLVGRLGRVEIRSDVRKGFRIPMDAIAYRDGKQYVRKIEQKNETPIAKFAEITLGPVTGEEIEVLTGVSTGERIVLRSSGFVADGQEVEIFTPPTANAAAKSAVETPAKSADKTGVQTR